MRRVVSVLTALALLALAAHARAGGGTTARVIVPDRESLQYPTFWLALGAGYFADEGYDIELVVPPAPQLAAQYFQERRADAAVLSTPACGTVIAARYPVVFIANLLANDPVELIVRRSIADSRHLGPKQPLRQKLEGMRGLKIGVGPDPGPQLRVLYQSVGLSPDIDATAVVIPDKDQNAAFHAGEVDALYVQTPFLERAIVQDDAVVIVDQAAGEIEGLKNRPFQVLGVQQQIIDAQRPMAVGLVRALLRAAKMMHRSPPEAIAVLAKMFPKRDRRELETIVNLYAPAVPVNPAVNPALFPTALLLYPAGPQKPDFVGVDFGRLGAGDIVSAAEQATPGNDRTVVLNAFFIVLIVIAIGLISARVRPHRRTVV